MTHDEVLMLIISCAVIVEVGATLTYVRRIPHSFLLLGGFAAFVASSFFTVIEGFVWPNMFNVLEHLSLMVGAILFALWCGLAFRRPKQEAP